jgi:hypothetical protein
MICGGFEVNAKQIAIVTVLGALGALLRYFAAIVVIPGVVELTPSFLIPQLAGMLMGSLGGSLCGVIVGVAGSIRGGEFPLIPLLGNVALGFSTGIVKDVVSEERKRMKKVLYVVSGALIGGFLPTFLISIFFVPIFASAFYALIDTFQAGFWVFIGIIILELLKKAGLTID